jgi:signal transduction histidine kinase
MAWVINLEVNKIRNGIRTQLTMTITLIVLSMVALITLSANIFINIEFKKYAEQQQNTRIQSLVYNLISQYNGVTQQWDTGYIHGIGMDALYDGYIIKLYDQDGKMVWDAENHDMALCKEIMDDITSRMNAKYKSFNGGPVSNEFNLKQNGQVIGKVSVTYYGPFFYSESEFELLSTLNLLLLIIGILSLFSSFIAGFLLSKRISRPIIKMANITTKIADGNYDIRFEGKTKTRELDELVTAVNNMASNLYRQESLRKQLTTDVAHELRTPLTVVSSHLEAMIDGIWEATPERLKSCYEEIERLSGLISDMESLAQIENDNLKLSKSQVDLLELTHTVRSNFEIESGKKNISIEVHGEPTVIDADRDRLNQVIINLLSNAIKYTPENGHVRITVKDTVNNGIITIEDDGIGIPEDELPLIFERFYRTDKSRNRKTGGAGIGLTIVKSIVNAHGGKIIVTSSTEQGSCFTVILPKSKNEI